MIRAWQSGVRSHEPVTSAGQDSCPRLRFPSFSPDADQATLAPTTGERGDVDSDYCFAAIASKIAASTRPARSPNRRKPGPSRAAEGGLMPAAWREQVSGAAGWRDWRHARARFSADRSLIPQPQLQRVD